MSRLALIRDLQFQQHITPEQHPESSARLAAIDQAFDSSAMANEIAQLKPRLALEDEIALVHNSGYIESLQEKNKRVSHGQFVQLDPDTFMSEKTFDIAKLACGAGLVGVDAIAKQEFASIFVAARPPGHHALNAKPLGFCLFNNIAVAAKYAQVKHSFKRILIIDWDVHHGNGTEAMFYADPSVCFISLHQFPFWPPGSGWYTSDGMGEGKGYNINIPLPAGTGDRGYFLAWDTIVKPISLEYKPELILVSAGYDAHQNDPIGGQRISTSGFAMLSQRLLDLVNATGANVACFLEGGYNTKALSESALATMSVLNASIARETAEVHVAHLLPGAAESSTLITNDEDPDEVEARIKEVRKHFAQYWRSLGRE